MARRRAALAPDARGARHSRHRDGDLHRRAGGAGTWLAAAIEREPLLRGEAAGEPLLALLVPEIS
jgi:hypothetical protein